MGWHGAWEGMGQSLIGMVPLACSAAHISAPRMSTRMSRRISTHTLVRLFGYNSSAPRKKKHASAQEKNTPVPVHASAGWVPGSPPTTPPPLPMTSPHISYGDILVMAAY